MKKDKTVVTFGHDDFFGPTELKRIHNLRNVDRIFNNDYTFCALMQDGTVHTWGHTDYGNDTEYVSNLEDIVDIYPVYLGYVAIDKNNKLFSWGGSYLNYIPPTNNEKIKFLVKDHFSVSVITENDILKDWGEANSVYGTILPNVKKLFFDYDMNAI